jgi:hypothetical protein
MDTFYNSHGEALASKSICLAFDEELQKTIKVVKLIKIRPLNFRCFEHLSLDMGAEHSSLLYYCDYRLFSREM